MDTQHPCQMIHSRVTQSARGVHIQKAASTPALLFDRYPATKRLTVCSFLRTCIVATLPPPASTTRPEDTDTLQVLVHSNV